MNSLLIFLRNFKKYNECYYRFLGFFVEIIEKFFIYRIVVLLVRVTRLPFFEADKKSFCIA